MTEDEMRELFREMGETAVPGDSLARVRSMVERGIRRRIRWNATGWIAAAASVVLCALLFYPASHPASHPAGAPVKPEVLARIETPPAETIPARAVPQPLRRVVRRRSRQPKPVLIRIETPDPDVVILLIGE